MCIHIQLRQTSGYCERYENIWFLPSINFVHYYTYTSISTLYMYMLFMQVPSQRANSHIIPEAGIHECTLVGTCKSCDNHVTIMHYLNNIYYMYMCTLDILKFDNSYSWSRSKEVFYSVKLLAPNVEPHPQTHPLPVFHIEIRKHKEEESTYRTPSPSPLSSEDEFFDCFQELGNSQETATASLQQTDSFSCSSHPKTSLRLTMSTPTLTQYRTTLPTSLGLKEMVITGTSISTQV